MKKKITVILVSAVIVIAIVSVVLSLPKKPYKDLTADRGKGCPYGVNKYKISYKKAYPAIRFFSFNYSTYSSTALARPSPALLAA